VPQKGNNSQTFYEISKFPKNFNISKISKNFIISKISKKFNIFTVWVNFHKALKLFQVM
jgi:hypothetical protein